MIRVELFLPGSCDWIDVQVVDVAIENEDPLVRQSASDFRSHLPEWIIVRISQSMSLINPGINKRLVGSLVSSCIRVLSEKQGAFQRKQEKNSAFLVSGRKKDTIRSWSTD